MKDFVRKDRMNYNALKNRTELEIAAKNLQMNIPMHKLLIEECNVDD